jgi:hypothetical protein
MKIHCKRGGKHRRTETRPWSQGTFASKSSGSAAGAELVLLMPRQMAAGYWLYDECYFYPHKKVVFRGRDFDAGKDSFLRSYGNIELRKKDYGVLDKLKREVSLTKIPQFSTLTDTDVIFHMLDKHMGLRWNK